MTRNKDNSTSDPSPNLWQVIASVLAAFIGIQNSKNRERDFKYGKPWQFIITGLILTAVFVLIVWNIVRLVLWSAGI